MAKWMGHHPDLLDALRAAGIVEDPNNVRRVVIDIQSGEAVKVYVELFGDERLVKVVEALSSVEVTQQ